MSGYFLNSAFDLGLKILGRFDRSFAFVFKLFLQLLESLRQSIARGKHLVGSRQGLTVGDHLADAMLLELVFDEIDELPRSHGVQFDSLIAQEVDRGLIETGFAQPLVADIGIIGFRRQAVDVAVVQSEIDDIRRRSCSCSAACRSPRYP